MKRQWRRFLSSGCGGNSAAEEGERRGGQGREALQGGGDTEGPETHVMSRVRRGRDRANDSIKMRYEGDGRRQTPNTRLFALNTYHVNPCFRRFKGPSRQPASLKTPAHLNNMMPLLGMQRGGGGGSSGVQRLQVR